MQLKWILFFLTGNLWDMVYELWILIKFLRSNNDVGLRGLWFLTLQVKIILFLLGQEGKIKILRGYCGGQKLELLCWASSSNY